MRTLLALVPSWLLAGQGKRRVPPPAEHTAGTTAAGSPKRRLIISPSPPTSCRRDWEDLLVVRADGSPLVRPYLVAHERKQERRRQRDRRRAAVPATLGQDYLAGVTA
ncbi:hypothetical protein GCM10010421_00390 [Streptomyces glaucus]|uniref:Secreted protein n=1 Tax=Streptomyces glaucus TaxID=284029 RepID=A0ABN3J2T0_9ACTN